MGIDIGIKIETKSSMLRGISIMMGTTSSVNTKDESSKADAPSRPIPRVPRFIRDPAGSSPPAQSSRGRAADGQVRSPY
ncbi:hypothetical protein EVAR_91580_1 [Eumeta japonica]|uniref:Uncharacterized protein n=1 Tax=Eumeta variegata TaxID=151549 RepID=A0A4C1X949_EUMVA|nr:hypothetical protein EVAR_91580_1 [Eumeta japonica]